jgi:phosphatidylserine/phosphatidylglycerophosphate/cardiolipin synthase-like enzyme
MIAKTFISAVKDARQHFTTDQWLKLIAAIENRSGHKGDLAAAELLPDVYNNDALWLLNKALKLRDDCSWAQVSAILSSVDALFEADAPHVTPVWSGPSNGFFPVRRFDQVLYDLIAQAHERILIVTFAAHKVGHLCDHLQAAITRGVSLTLILETAEASEGQLSFNALNAFSVLSKGSYSIYYWPLDRRPRNNAGRPGKLHVKCAVVDSTALVGSGNLTDDAFNRNMELGLLLKDISTANVLYNHFLALVANRELVAHDTADRRITAGT